MVHMYGADEGRSRKHERTRIRTWLIKKGNKRRSETNNQRNHDPVPIRYIFSVVIRRP